MMLNNFLSETRAIDVRVDFCGGNTLVAEHRLYGAQVGTAFEQMGGKRVTESVRAYNLVDAHDRHKFLDYMEHCDSRQRLPAAVA